MVSVGAFAAAVCARTWIACALAPNAEWAVAMALETLDEKDFGFQYQLVQEKSFANAQDSVCSRKDCPGLLERVRQRASPPRLRLVRVQ